MQQDVNALGQHKNTQPTTEEWRIGHNFINLHSLYIERLEQVGQNVWQPVLRYCEDESSGEAWLEQDDDTDMDHAFEKLIHSVGDKSTDAATSQLPPIHMPPPEGSSASDSSSNPPGGLDKVSQ